MKDPMRGRRAARRGAKNAARRGAKDAARLAISVFLSAAMALAPALRAAEDKPPPAAPEPSDPDAAKARADFLKKADTLISDNNYDVKATAHYKVRTDDPRLDEKATADLLESFRGFFDGFWKGRLELKPYDDVSQIFLFYSYFKYKQMLGETTGLGARPVGHYQIAADTIALHTDSAMPGDLAGVLVHEAAHQLIHNRIYGGESRESIWISEGMASYFGHTAWDAESGFRAGDIGRSGAVLLKTKATPKGFEAPAKLAGYRAALKKGQVGVVDAVIRIEDPREFYGSSIAEAYTSSWLLVHFLLHADGGRYAAGFAGYLRLEAEGNGGSEAFYRATGLSPDSIQDLFEAHVRNLKVR